jgi:hypothetical protein
MIRAISTDWFNLIQETPIYPSEVYGILAQKCFCEELKGPAVEALRRGLSALNNWKPFRKTPEFEKLIEFEG